VSKTDSNLLSSVILSLKKWDDGHEPRGRVWEGAFTLLSYEGPGYNPGKFLKI